MLDLVSKAVVIRDLIAYQYECFSTIGHEETFNAIDHIIKGVMDMPTVGATPVVHGHWIGKPLAGYSTVKCSACGSAFVENNGKWKYCPDCGAKMDEPTQSNNSNTLGALGEKVTE